MSPTMVRVPPVVVEIADLANRRAALRLHHALLA